MSQLKRLIREIHRRSLWQVLGIYLLGAWIGYEVIQGLTEGLGLPEWFPALALVLFIVGLPVVLATAFLQEGVQPSTQQDLTLMSAEESGAEPYQTGERRGDGGARRILTWRNAFLGGMAAFALWGVVATGWLLLAGTTAREAAEAHFPTSPTRIAVLPFSVRGSDEFAYLGEGMVDLLGTKLDGAGELRSVDARALLGVFAQQGGGPLDPERGLSIAQRFGAGLYVLGNILEVGGRLRLDASLYDAGRGSRVVAQATAESAADQIFEAVDNLAAQLLGSRSAGPGERITRIAAVTTHSLPALKAYLEGGKEFRSGRFEPAVEAFKRAVQLDTSFALAWYRLSVAREWALTSHLAPEAAEQAVRHSRRLSERDRRLLEALLATRRGQAREAEQLYRAIVGSYPDDIEAWFQLGELLFHYGPPRGRSIVESRAAWERVLSFEPEHVTSLIHLARIAAREDKPAELDSLVSRVLQLIPAGERGLEMRALRAFAFGDRTAQEELMDLGPARENRLVIAVWVVATYTDNLVGAEKMARLLVEPQRSPDLQGFGHVVLAHFELAQGHWHEAKLELTQAGLLGAASALEYRALLSTVPFLPVTEKELEELHASVERWDAASVPPGSVSSDWLSVHDDLHSHLRTYLLGLLSARLEKDPEALRYATQLEQQAGSSKTGSLLADMARGVRAQVALSEGKIADAIAELERIRMEVWYNHMVWSPFFNQAQQRFVRAQLLQQTGRQEEALRWYSSFAEHSIFDLIYLAPSHLYRAEIYEELGDRKKAAEHYARFVELWKECDPELRPMLESAQARLAGLTEELEPS